MGLDRGLDPTRQVLGAKTGDRVVFTIEVVADPELIDMQSVLDTLRENGEAQIVKVEIRKVDQQGR